MLSQFIKPQDWGFFVFLIQEAVACFDTLQDQ